MIFRIVNEERMEQVRQLWAYAFEKPADPFYQWYFSDYCGRDNTVIGGFDARDKLQTMLHLNPYMLRIRGAELLTPYIVGVATAPEARGQHLFKPLLETAFEVLRSQNFPFVILMPVVAGIYLPYQFSYCYYRHSYAMAMSQLQPGPADAALRVERTAPEHKLLAELYARLTAAWNAVPLRTDFQWAKLLKVHELEEVQCAICYANDLPAGYLLYKIEHGVFQVVELLSESQPARNRLLQYAAAHRSEAQRFSWLAEAWDKTYLAFNDQSLSGSLQPFMMARCLDARRALASLPQPAGVADGAVKLLLTDKLISRNNHLLQLTVTDGQLQVGSSVAEEEIAMDMAAFTQMYFGAFSASELWEAGMLRVADSSKLAWLDQLFPKCRNYINEYF